MANLTLAGSMVSRMCFNKLQKETITNENFVSFVDDNAQMMIARILEW